MDNDGSFARKYDTSQMSAISLAGERADAPSIHWLHKQFPHVVINDSWWHTESGFPVGSNILNKDVYGPIFPTLPGSTTKAVPGWDVRLFTDEGEEAERGMMGKICMKQPLPPTHALTLWNNDEAYVEKYLTEVPGYFNTGDEGLIDERGYLQILGRTDDVINVAGHRLDTGRLEESINKHVEVVESAVIGLTDKMKGEVPMAFVLVKGDSASMSKDQLQKIVDELNYMVR